MSDYLSIADQQAHLAVLHSVDQANAERERQRSGGPSRKHLVTINLKCVHRFFLQEREPKTASQSSYPTSKCIAQGCYASLATHLVKPQQAHNWFYDGVEKSYGPPFPVSEAQHRFSGLKPLYTLLPEPQAMLLQGLGVQATAPPVAPHVAPSAASQPAPGADEQPPSDSIPMEEEGDAAASQPAQAGSASSPAVTRSAHRAVVPASSSASAAGAAAAPAVAASSATEVVPGPSGEPTVGAIEGVHIPVFLEQLSRRTMDLVYYQRLSDCYDELGKKAEELSRAQGLNMNFSDPATNVLQQVLQVRCLVHAHKDKEERRCPPFWTFRLVAEPNARDMVITIETVEQLLGCLLSASNLQWEALCAFLTKSSYDLSPTYTMASYDTHVQEFRDKLVWLPYVVDTEINEDSDCVRKAFLATFVDKEFPFLFNRKHQGTHEHDVPFHQLVKQVRRLVLQKCQTEVAQLHRHQLDGTVSSMVSGNNSYSNANRDLLPFVSKPAGSGSGSGGRNQPDRKRKQPGRKNQPPGQPGKRRTQNPAGPADHGTVSCNFCHRPHEAEKCFFKHPHNAPNKWRRAHGLTQLSDDERAKFVSAKGSRKERPANSRLWEACLKAAKKGNFQLSKVQQSLKRAQAS